MESANPFIIQIPPYNYTVDLSPILIPIIHSIREEIRHHESRLHWGNHNNKIDRLDPADAYAYMVQAIDGVEYDRLIRVIDRQAIIDYAVSAGFTLGESGYCLSLHSIKVRVFSPTEELGYVRKHEAVSTLARYMHKERVQVAREIDAKMNPLDKIANEL